MIFIIQRYGWKFKPLGNRKMKVVVFQGYNYSERDWETEGSPKEHYRARRGLENGFGQEGDLGRR